MPVYTDPGGGQSTTRDIDWNALYRTRLALEQKQRDAAAQASKLRNASTSRSLQDAYKAYQKNQAVRQGVSAAARNLPYSQMKSVAQGSGGGGSGGSGGGSGGGAGPGNGSDTGINGLPSTTPGGTTGTTPITPGKIPANAAVKDNSFYAKYGQTSPYAAGSKPIASTNDWLKDTLTIAMPQIVADPKQMISLYAAQRGYGRGVEGLLSNYTDPAALAQMLGSNATDAETLGFAGGFMDRALHDTGGTSSMDPRKIVQRVFGQSGEDNSATSLGQQLYGSGPNMPSQNPAAQVANTLQFLNGALQGMVSQEIKGAYLNLLEDQGRQFLSWKQTPAGAVAPANFGQWVLTRLGPNAGF